MITWLRLRNWRSFPPAAAGFPLGRLTALVGENSAGKSSILRALVVLAQSFEGRYLPESLVTIGPRGEFGLPSSVPHAIAASHTSDMATALAIQTIMGATGTAADLQAIRANYWAVEFVWDASLGHAPLAAVNFFAPAAAESRLVVRTLLERDPESGDSWLRLDLHNIEALARGDREPLSHGLAELTELARSLAATPIQQQEWQGDDDDEDGGQVGYWTDCESRLTWLDTANLRLNPRTGTWQCRDTIPHGDSDTRFIPGQLPSGHFWHQLRGALDQTEDAARGESASRAATALAGIQRSLESVRNQMKLLTDLGPMRVSNDRVQARSRTDTANTRVGRSGEHVADILVQSPRYAAAASTILSKHLRLTDLLASQPVGEPLVVLEVTVETQGRRPQHLADVGVGVSQVVPIATMLAMTARDRETQLLPACIAIEQPELHLHPATQAELADVLLKHAGLAPADFDGETVMQSAYDDNPLTWPQVLVETHSPAMLARWTRDYSRPITDVCVLHVIRDSDGAARVVVR